MATNPYVVEKDGRKVITPEGYAVLDRLTTNSRGQVYAFTPEAPPVLVAAAMARLSRRMGDMRLTYVDEFAVQEGQADAVLERVITQYGDDSVQQLTGLHLVVEGASNLLTKLLEWGRLCAYLEQSTRYIYFDEVDEEGNYRYYIPDLDPETHSCYMGTMDEVFQTYSNMVRGVTEHVRQKLPQGENPRVPWLNSTRAQACDAVRPVLPVATKSTVGIFGSSQAIESLIMHLRSEPLREAQKVGDMILEEARQVMPVFLQRADLPDRGGAITAYRANTRAAMRDIAAEYLTYDFEPTQEEDVSLIWHAPERELELVAEMLFENAKKPLPIQEIQRQVATWNQARLEEVFNTYFGERLNRRQKPGRALEKAHFEWQIIGDYGTFRDLQRHRVVDAFEWPRLSTDYGYDVPVLVVEAGYEEQFRWCFAAAEKLYAYLMSRGYELEAQYATLLGHRLPYRFILNARAHFHFLELRTHPTGHPGYRRLCNRIFELFGDRYPLTAGAMRFINSDPDPELTRLAAERYSDYKLGVLEAKNRS